MSNRTLINYINKYNIMFDGVLHLGAYNVEEIDIYNAVPPKYVIWAEANPDKWGGIQNTLNKYKNNDLFRGAITDKDGQHIKFNIYNAKEACSIFDIGEDLKLWYPHHQVEKKVSVVTSTIDSLFEMFNRNIEQCNFMNMDIQGAEVIALAGAPKLLASPYLQYIYTEVCWAEFYKDIEPTLDVMTELLKDYKFKMVEMAKDVHKAYSPQTQAMIDRGEFPEVAQADVLFQRIL